MFEVLETRVLPNVTGPVQRGPLEYARVWKVAQRQTRKPVKFGAISGQMVATGVHDQHFKNRRDLIMALSKAMNEELHRARRCRLPGDPGRGAGDPRHGRRRRQGGDGRLPGRGLQPRGGAACADKCEVWCHTCWGNPAAQRTETKRRFYTQALPYFDKLDVDVITFEAADNGGDEIESFAKGISAAQEDRHRRHQPPHAAGGAARGGGGADPPRAEGDPGRAADRVDRLRLRPPGHEPPARVLQDGLAGARHEYRAQELGLPEADILAADPKGSLIG